MSTAQDIIRQVSATGARLVLVNGGVGFSKPLPENLVALAREHKAEIRRELERQAGTDKAEGLRRLEVAAQGLPATIKELAEFFADDLPSFGSGEVKRAGIRKACEWFAYIHMGR